MTTRIGLVGTNTSHAGVFAELLNGTADSPARVPGARVVGVWGSERAGLSGPHPDARELQEKFGIDTVVTDPARLIGSVDAAIVVDDAGGGSLHPELAEPFLTAGLPTFIDKPMTLTVAEANALFDRAEQHGAPLMSSSALRFSAELRELRERLPDLGALSSVVMIGPGDWYNYGVHAVEVAQAVAGNGAAWVHQHSSEQRDVTVIGYAGSRPTTVVETLRDSVYAFHVNAYGADGFARAEITDSAGFYAGTMAAFVEMTRTGTPPVGRADTIEVLSILAAGQRSAETGDRVELDPIAEARWP
ncbi:MAG TPA: Gfo/Idh/MocA family oxidoreductase [Mycobacteriales bacterium]|nr:Gfo/Idh/MocA family oxidoreductase [Mycobacteriales bacterium]